MRRAFSSFFLPIWQRRRNALCLCSRERERVQFVGCSDWRMAKMINANENQLSWNKKNQPTYFSTAFLALNSSTETAFRKQLELYLLSLSLGQQTILAFYSTATRAICEAHWPVAVWPRKEKVPGRALCALLQNVQRMRTDLVGQLERQVVHLHSTASSRSWNQVPRTRSKNR